MERFASPPSPEPDDEDGRSQRGRARDSLFLMGRLTLATDKKVREVRIRNLSEGGLMIEADRPVAIGTAVTLDMRGVGDVTGQVAWCAEGRIGIAFDRPINPQLARKPVGGGGTTPVYAKPVLGSPR